MTAVSGSPTQLVTCVLTPRDLAGVPDDGFHEGDFAFVSSLAPNGSFRLERGVAAIAPDNVSTIDTFSGNGYWELFARDVPLYFPTVASIGAYDDRGLASGVTGYEAETRSNWQKQVESPAPLGDGITIVPTKSGDGAWYRSTVPSPTWQWQQVWEIDAAAGSDTGSGVPGSPLQTWTEFARRVQVIVLEGTTVQIKGVTVDPIVGTFIRGARLGTLIIEGVPTVDAFADATTFVDPSFSSITNRRGTITCGDLVFDASYVGKFARVAADPTTAITLSRGPYMAPILDVSAGIAQIPFWARWSQSTTAPANGRRVEILSLPTTSTIQIQTNGVPVQIKFMRVDAQEPAHSTSSNNAVFVERGALLGMVNPSALAGYASQNCTFFGCAFADATVGGRTATSAFACLCIGITRDTVFFGDFQMTGGGILGNLILEAGERATFQGAILQGGSLLIPSGPSAFTPTVVRLASGGLGFGIFGSPTDGVIIRGPNAILTGGALYGGGATSRNTGYGVNASAGARVYIPNNSTLTGLAGDLIMDGATTAVPPPSSLGVWQAAADFSGIDGAGWTKWIAAPFNRQLMNYGNQTMISGA